MFFVDLGGRFHISISLQQSAPVKPRTRSIKFARSPCTDIIIIDRSLWYHCGYAVDFLRCWLQDAHEQTVQWRGNELGSWAGAFFLLPPRSRMKRLVEAVEVQNVILQ